MQKKTISSSISTKRKHVKKRRLVLIVISAFVVVVLLAIIGIPFFQGWRARDLAIKARENFENANYRMARIQLLSAKEMRSSEPDVLRSSAIIHAGFGDRTALDYWDKLAKVAALTPADLKDRAHAVARFGNDEQFNTALTAFATVAEDAEVAQLRAARDVLRGNMDRAIDESIQMAETFSDPSMKLDAIRLLIRRHIDRLSVPENPAAKVISARISKLIDSLMGTSQEQMALALGLSFLQIDDAKKISWAETAMKDVSVDNSALLPAASVLVNNGKIKSSEIYHQFRPVFDSASLDRRAAFADWLTQQKMPKEALSLITAQEALESLSAYNARIMALAEMGNWQAVIDMSNMTGNVSESAHLMARARAEFAVGRGAQSGAKTAIEAVRVASKEGDIGSVIMQMDSIGAQDAVDSALVELSGDPRSANIAFQIARDRFTRRNPGGGPLLAAARERIEAVSPDSSSLKDYERFQTVVAELAKQESEKTTNDKAQVSAETTLEALEKAPTDPAIRITHALVLVRDGRTKEGAALFDDFTLFFNRLAPPLQAAIAAIMSAGGEPNVTKQIKSVINPAVLTPNEQQLLR